MANIAEEKAIKAIRAAIERDTLSSEADTFNNAVDSTVASIDFWVGKRNSSNIYSTVSLDDEHTIAAIREYVPNNESFASAANVEKAFIVNASGQEDKQKLNKFLWNEEGTEPDWSNMPLEYEQVKKQEEIEQLLNPAELKQDSSRLLVIQWKGGPDQANISVAGLTE